MDICYRTQAVQLDENLVLYVGMALEDTGDHMDHEPLMYQ